jgi:predicted enzyme related to lactoylglutathione lyase
MKQKMNSIVHFEMPFKDGRRMADFYTKAFGWQTQQMDEKFGNYIVATTTESDQKTGRPKSPGAINGGFYPQMKDGPQCPSVVVGVDDIKASVKKVTEAGGKVIGEPMDIPGVGLYVSFYDTEGNRVSMLQPNM